MAKKNVTSWKTVNAYVATFPHDNDLGEGACDVLMQIGCDGSNWYIRTTDDAGGSDECDDTAYATAKDAEIAADVFANDKDEGMGDTAEEYLAKMRARAQNG